MTSITRKIITTAAAALALTVAGGVAAEASSKPTKADKVAMVKANRACAEVESEVNYEACVVGEFVLARNRYIDGTYFTTDFGRTADKFVVLVKHSKKV